MASSSQSLAAGSYAPNPQDGAFRELIAKLFLANRFSGPETCDLIRRAFAAGARGIDSMRMAVGTTPDMKSVSRNLMREFLKSSSAPPLYWADIFMQNADTKEETLVAMPFLLPHEMLGTMFTTKGANIQDFVNINSPQMKKIKDDMCVSLGVDLGTFIPLGLFGDGVPHQKSQSIEVVSWNCLAAPESERVLCCIADKKVLQPQNP